MPGRRADRLKDHPLLVYFGALCDPLDRDRARDADFLVRVESIGRFLVREVLRFHKRLSPQGKVNYDPEDLILECWIELRKRNQMYDAARGGYRTFAARVIRNTFLAISEKARCVKLPANSAGELGRKGDAGPGDAGGRSASLHRAASDHADIEPHIPLIHDRRPSPIDGLIWLEERERIGGDVAARIGGLDTLECLAIGTVIDPFGGSTRTLAEIGEQYGIEPGLLRKALKTAKQKLIDGYYADIEIPDEGPPD